MMDFIRFIGFITVCMVICLTITPAKVFADEVITSTAIIQEGEIFELNHYIPRLDTPTADGKAWLEAVSAPENGFIPQQCTKTGHRKHLCDRIEWVKRVRTSAI
jgi:hypothetical protein